MKSALTWIGSILFFYATTCYANTDLGPGIVNARNAPYSAPVSANGLCNAADTDATTGIQNALNAVNASGGGIVYLPTGTYCVKTRLVVPDSTVLKGVFVAPPSTNLPAVPYGIPKGTVLLAVADAGYWTPTATPFIKLSGPGAGVDGLSILYPNQTNPASGSWAPTAYPPAIGGSVPDMSVQNVLLVNPYHAINFDGNPGRHYIRAVYGQPLWVGIQIEGSLDVGRILDVHFWPFWSLNTPVLDYVRNNGFGFVIGRTDWQVMQDIFTYGYHVGMQFNSGPAGGANGQFTNVGIDGARHGIVLAGTHSIGLQFTNFNYAAHTTDGVGIFAFNQASTISVNNASFWGSYSSAVRWSSSGLITMTGAKLLSSSAGTPIIDINNGKAMIRGNSFESTPNSGVGIRIGASAGKVMINDNMMLGKTITVLNGANTLQADNQP